VPGLHIPDAIIKRLAGAGTEAQREGRTLCVELLQELREIRGVAGAHIMAYRQEQSVREIIERAGVLAGREPWFPGRDLPTSDTRTST
jgi:methylenetetrahydrofolate reductase (NADPH)